MALYNPISRFDEEHVKSIPGPNLALSKSAAARDKDGADKGGSQMALGAPKSQGMTRGAQQEREPASTLAVREATEGADRGGLTRGEMACCECLCYALGGGYT